MPCFTWRRCPACTPRARAVSSCVIPSSLCRVKARLVFETDSVTFGTLAMASYGVGSTILQVVMIPAMGLSMAVAALVGQNIGAGNIDRAARIARLGASIGFWTLTVLGLIAFFFARALVAFFVPNDPNVIAEGAVFVRTMALSWGCIGAQFSLTGVLRASGNMVVAMVLTLVGQWVLQFPLAYLLSEHAGFGMRGIWIAFPIANVIITLLTIAVYARGDWKRKRLTAEDELLDRVTEETLADTGAH